MQPDLDHTRPAIVAPAAQPVMDTARLVLRPARRADAGLLALQAGDWRVARHTRSIPHPLPPGSTDAFIARAARADRTEDVWVIDGHASGLPEVAGVLGLERRGQNVSQVGFWIAPGFWGVGIASEAVEALVERNPHDAHEIVAEVFQDNPASAKVLSHAQFTYLGEGASYSVARQSRVACWRYSRVMPMAGKTG